MKKHTYSQSTGFALSELIAILALGWLIVGMALPAVTASREAARKLSCINNLRQLGLALRTYENTYKSFPHAGAYFWNRQSRNPYTWHESSHGGSFVKLLPFIEQDPLYKAFFASPRYVGVRTEQPFKGWSRLETAEVESGSFARSKVIDTLICPSAQVKPHLHHTDIKRAPAIATYGFNIGSQSMSSNKGMCLEYPGDVFKTGPADHGNDARGYRISGVFARGAWAVRLRDVSDGESQVIAIGEVLPHKSDFMAKGWAHMDSMWAATVGPINYPIVGIGDPGFAWDKASKKNPHNCTHFSNWSTSQAFKSRHKGGAEFVFVDGSVHFLSTSIDYILYQRLGDRRDGGPISYDAFGR